LPEGGIPLESEDSRSNSINIQGRVLPQSSFTNDLEGISVMRIEEPRRPPVQGAESFGARASHGWGAPHAESGSASTNSCFEKMNRNQTLEGDHWLKGEWTAEENNLFFNALELCGNEFAMLHEAVQGSKSREQVCTLKDLLVLFLYEIKNWVR
jgi:hypothetical protein